MHFIIVDKQKINDTFIQDEKELSLLQSTNTGIKSIKLEIFLTNFI